MIGLGLLGLFVVGVIALFVIAMTGVGVYNSAITARNAYYQQEKQNEAVFDNMKKKMGDYVAISDDQWSQLKEIFVKHAEARTNQSQNQLMTWVKESVPNVDNSISKEILRLVTATRDEWTRNQEILVQKANSYNTAYLDRFPNSAWTGVFNSFCKDVVKDREGNEKVLPRFRHIDALIVTSSKTKDAFRTGEDNEPSVFKK